MYKAAYQEQKWNPIIVSITAYCDPYMLHID